MADSAKLKLNFGYADDTSRDLEIGNLDTDATLAATLKTNIKAFNPTSVQNIFVSDTGASCTGIQAATLFEVSETEINLNDAE